MDVKDMQKKAVEIVDTIDRKLNVDRDLQLNFTQLMEEMGELAREINSEKLRKRKPGRESLEEEFADVFLQLVKLADMVGVDLGDAVEKKIAILKKRHGI